MKIRTLLATCLIGIGVVGVFGHSLAIDAGRAHQQDTVAQWQQQRAALVADNNEKVTALNADLQATKLQVSTLTEANATITAQRQAACLRLTRAGITIPECRQ